MMMMMNRLKDMKVFVMKHSLDGIIMKLNNNGHAIQEKKHKKFKIKLFFIIKIKNYLDKIQGDHKKIL